MKMIETLKQLTNVSVSGLISIGCLLGVAPSLTAQVPSIPGTESDNGTIDERRIIIDEREVILDGRMVIRTCLQGDRKIKVDAQNYSGWQETIERGGWECSQPKEIPPELSGEIKFYCEPQDGTIALLTVTWLEGAGGESQMQTWMEEIQSKPKQGCRMGRVGSS